MIRKLLLLIAVTLGCLASPAYGLGLGELELKSALNQQFNAQIKLTNVRGLQVEEILPNLASQEDFDRVGVERNYLLTDLRFKVGANDQGDLVIFVTSSKPVIEPFLNFIVEVLWPTGRILREYTVLLDPPVFGQQGVAPIQPSTVESKSAARTSAQPIPPGPIPSEARPAIQPTVSAQPKPVSSNRTKQQEDASGKEYGMTGQGDTLWKIALRVRPDRSVSVQQTMLALQRANPEAFINNNINLLKAGYVLRIPDVREIQSESVASAVEEVRTQNQQFASYKGGSLAQLDATKRKSGSVRPKSEGSSGELKLLASDDATGDRSGSGGSAKVQALESELAVAEEDLDRARRANSEMNVKVDDLQSQLDTLNKILTLKDDQLAALKAEVQKMQAAPSQPAAVQPAAKEAGSLFTNPLMLGALGLLIVGAIAGGMIFMRRRQQSGEIENEFEDVYEEPELEEHEEQEPALEESPVIEEEEEDLSPETSDVISEVEIYIAYGRFPQAITFLQNAIQAEPDRSDIQLKLLEVFVQTEDGIAFNLQLEQLRLLNDQDAVDKALELQKKIPGAAEDAAAAMDATIISMEPIEAIPEADDDDLSFDLDDLDSETEEDDLTLGPDDDDLDLSLDADDDLDLADELDASAGTLKLEPDEIELKLDSADDDNAGDDELDLDLDIDLDDELSLDLDDLDDDLVDDLDEKVVEEDDGLTLELDDDDVLDLSDIEEDDFDLEKDLESVSKDLETATKDDADDILLDLDDDLDIDLEGDDLDLGSLDDLDDDNNEDEITLDLDDEDDVLDLEGDEISLDLDDEDEISLDLEDDEFSLDLDDDEFTLDLDDEDDNKLDLARAYIDMGDSEGAKNLLQQVLDEGTDQEKHEATDLLEKID